MLIDLLIGLVVLAVIWWIIGFLGLPEPIRRIATVILVVVAVLWLLGLLFGVDTGVEFPRS